MKVLIFNNAALTPHGNDFCIETQTGAFAKELKDLRNDIILFGQIVYDANNVHVYQLHANGLKIYGLKRKKNKIINYILLYLKAIPAIWESDFVYIFYPNAFKYAALIAILFKKKYGLYIRGMQNLNDKMSYFIFKNAYVILTVSDYFTQFVNNTVGLDIAYTIRPMIPFTERDIIKDREYKRKDLYQILYLGRTTNDKGIIELLHAISKLKETDLKFFLKIVGNGEYIEELKKLTENLNLNRHVSFEGAIYDTILVKEYYKDADIYILPTYHEGFPRTLYEAMIFGTPIITTFVGGIPSLMQDNYNCLKIESKSIESIFNVLSKALNDYAKMGKLAKNATKTIQKILLSRKISHAKQLNYFINRNA